VRGFLQCLLECLGEENLLAKFEGQRAKHPSPKVARSSFAATIEKRRGDSFSHTLESYTSYTP